MHQPPYHLTADEQRRIEQIDAWAALGGDRVPQLVGAMADASWTVRRAAVSALGALGDDAVPALAAWLANARTTEHAIAAAVDALAMSLGTTVAAAVIPLLAHRDPNVAADAAQILARRRAVEGIGPLAALIGHPDDNVALAAIDALGAIGGGTVVEPLIAVLDGGNFFRTFAALQVLPRTGDPRIVAPLAAHLANETYRVEAIGALGRTGLAGAIAPLAEILLGTRTDLLVRPIARALADLLARAEWTGAEQAVVAEMRARVRPAVARFVTALRGAEPDERRALATVLGRVGDASALPALARLLDDAALSEIATAAIQQLGREEETALHAALAADDPGTRLAALPAVASGGATGSARPAADVLRLLGDEAPEVRAGACDALARIGDTSTAVIAALFEALADPHAGVAHAAAAAIQSLGSSETAPRAIAAVATGAPGLRRQALRVIAYLGCAGAFDVVRAAIGDPDRRIAELAVMALGALDDPRVGPELATLAASPVEAIRAAVMRATAVRSDAGAMALLPAGSTDAAPWVRYYACQGLGRLGLVEAAPLLVARLADPAPHVRIAAVEALARLRTPAAWQALEAALASPEPDERRAALVGIATRSEPGALGHLLAGIADADSATRLIALSGLARRPEVEAFTALVDIARANTPADRDAGVADAALSLLADRADVDRAAADALVDLTLASPVDHRVHAALSRDGDVRVQAIATRLARTTDAEIATLVAALGRMAARPPGTNASPSAALAALIVALDSPLATVRRAVATSLVANTAGAEAAGVRDRVALLAASDPDLDVRRACAAALEVPAP